MPIIFRQPTPVNNTPAEKLAADNRKSTEHPDAPFFGLIIVMMFLFLLIGLACQTR
jgi:hypothetical protein